MFNAKRNNVQAFRDGVWRPILGGKFRIARAGNPDYERALEESGYRKMDDPEDRYRAFLEAMARGILKDWSEVTDAEGEAIPFNVNNAVEVLDENPDLVNAILEEARDMSNYRRQDVEDQAKKPANSSGGARSGKREAEA